MVFHNLVDVSDIFLLGGTEKGEAGARGRGGGFGFVLKMPGGGVLPRGGGTARGPGVSPGNWGGGGGAKFFFFGAEMSTKISAVH